MSYRIGIDIGGTFTDFTVLSSTGALLLWKEDTTADDPAKAIIAGLQAIAGQLDTDVRALLNATQVLVHGTTVATNMLIQRSGPTVGLACTSGFRDVLYFRDGYKPDRFNLHMAHPEGLVDRWLRLGVVERMDPWGNEVTALDEGSVRAVAAAFRDAHVEAVAIAFLWSIVNPAHELHAAEILRDELPGVHVICSHRILPEIREWERTSATVMSAYILPRVEEYLRELEGELSNRGFTRPVLIMQANGGCARVTDIIDRPINILASGPAAAPAAALYFQEILGLNLITLDMGGTSLDVCLIRDGTPAMSRYIQVEQQPIGVTAVDVHSIGAGGGSIAWVDGGGALRVGPRSAGARPGPACYDLGGRDPTVTDANVVLGYLDPAAFLGGRRVLRADLAERALSETIAEPLGLSLLEAAAGVIKVVNSNMVGAIRAVSVERGIDPRGFALLCGGGAGGLHCTELARELGMRSVFVPREAGVLCSFGMTVTDIRHDYVAAYHAVSTGADLAAIASLLHRLEMGARRGAAEEGLSEDEVLITRAVDARYPGQHRELTVVLPPGDISSEVIASLELKFHEQHKLHYAYERRDLAVEFLHWRVTATAKQVRSDLPSDTSYAFTDVPTNVIASRARQAWFSSANGLIETPCYDSAALGSGTHIAGPALVFAPTTTIVLHPGDEMTTYGGVGFKIDVAPRGEVAGAASRPLEMARRENR